MTTTKRRVGSRVELLLLPSRAALGRADVVAGRRGVRLPRERRDLGPVVVAVAVLIAGCGGAGAQLRPVDPFAAVIEATDDYPLVALGEYHQMQQWHDFMGELLLRPAFVDNVDDLVVEFGNALYQDVADRFVLDLEPVPFAELSVIWRNTIGGRVLWDAPVYEQFFRNVRGVNESLPSDRRIRVLLGDPDVDFDQVRSAADTAELDKGNHRDAFFAEVVEREVIAHSRRAVLIAGADHLRRGVHANTGPNDPNAVTLLAHAHPGELFVVYPLPFGYDESLRQRAESDFNGAPQPSLAYLHGTWLDGHEVTHRALDDSSRFGDQVDAIIWFGPDSSLTLSRADPAIYRSGDYAAELRRRSAILSEYFQEPIDYVAEGLRLATAESGRLAP